MKPDLLPKQSCCCFLQSTSVTAAAEAIRSHTRPAASALTLLPQHQGQHLSISPRTHTAPHRPVPRWLPLWLGNPELLVPRGTGTAGWDVPPSHGGKPTHRPCCSPLPSIGHKQGKNLNLISIDRCDIQQWVSAVLHPQEGPLDSQREANCHTGKWHFAFKSVLQNHCLTQIQLLFVGFLRNFPSSSTNLPVCLPWDKCRQAPAPQTWLCVHVLHAVQGHYMSCNACDNLGPLFVPKDLHVPWHKSEDVQLTGEHFLFFKCRPQSHFSSAFACKSEAYICNWPKP